MNKKFIKYISVSVITSILINSYVIVDGMFIGQMIGDIGLSAINIAWPITAILQSFGIAFGISGGIYVTRNKKANNGAKSAILITVLLFSIAIASLLFLLEKPLLTLFGASGDTLNLSLEYLNIILIGAPFQLLGLALPQLLKNSNKIKIATCSSIVSIVVNFILDYVFIIALNMSLFGAALGSSIAMMASFIFSIIFYFKELGKPKFSKRLIKEFFLGASAPFILNYSYAFILILTNYLCVKYGGNEAVAAYTLLSYILYIVNATAQACGDGVQPLFSENSVKAYKAKDNNKMLLFSMLTSVILISILNMIFYVFKDELRALYNLSEMASNYFNDAIRFYLIGFIAISITKVACSYLYSINDKIKANILTIIEPIVLTPIMFLILCPSLELEGLWISFTIIQYILLFIALQLLYHSYKKEMDYGWLFYNW